MRLPCTGRPAVLARLEPTFSRSQRPLGNAPHNVSRSGYFCLPLSIYFTGASHAASCTPYRRANSRHHYIDGSPQSRGSPGLGYFSGARTSLHGSQQTLLTSQRQSCKPSKLILYPVSPPTLFSFPFSFHDRRASHAAIRTTHPSKSAPHLAPSHCRKSAPHPAPTLPAQVPPVPHHTPPQKRTAHCTPRHAIHGTIVIAIATPCTTLAPQHHSTTDSTITDSTTGHP